MAINPRRIIYASVADNIPTSIISAAETWGALKDENQPLAAKAQGMKAHIKEGSIEITSNNQYLPTGDFTVYLLLEKNKSGNEVEEVLEEFMVSEVDPVLNELELTTEDVPF